MQTNEAIKLWKELGITECVMDFSCGGDSMNDTEFHFYAENKNKSKKKNEPSSVEIKSQELKDYFEEEVYNRVEFYVNSDGHYQGEAGQVTITLDEDDEPDFSYSKNATAEFNERGSEITDIKLTKEQAKFVSEYVRNINGSGDGDFTINYKKDFIVTDELEKLISDLEEVITKEVADFSPENPLGELNDFYTFTTNSDDEELENLSIEGNKLKMIVNNEYYVFTPSVD